MKRETILVVDDQPGMLRTVERVLGGSYHVVSARTPAEALAKASEQAPDLVLLDVRMPVLDGFELLPLLREAQPGIDAIFMTGSVHELDAHHIRAIREKAFYFIQKPFDREVLLTLVDRCLELRKLSRRNREHTRRLEAELAAGRAFQRGMLPGERLDVGRLALRARFLPCEELGGDLYDFVDAGGGSAAFLVADVSGHGVAAAMLTGIVKAAFREARAEGFAPLAVLRRIAGSVRSFDEGRFVTVFAGLASSDGSLEYVNAGHPAALLAGAERGLAELPLTGPLVSPAYPDLDWEAARIETALGERLLVHTDGITEARDDEGNLFGEERLRGLVRRGTGDCEVLLEEILAAERSFAGGRPAGDDRTVVCVAWTDA